MFQLSQKLVAKWKKHLSWEERGRHTSTSSSCLLSKHNTALLIQPFFLCWVISLFLPSSILKPKSTSHLRTLINYIKRECFLLEGKNYHSEVLHLHILYFQKAKMIWQIRSIIWLKCCFLLCSWNTEITTILSYFWCIISFCNFMIFLKTKI